MTYFELKINKLNFKTGFRSFLLKKDLYLFGCRRTFLFKFHYATEMVRFVSMSRSNLSGKFF